MKKGVLVTAADLAAQLVQPNGGGLRLRTVLTAMARAFDEVAIVLVSPTVPDRNGEIVLASEVRASWSLDARISIASVRIEPLEFGRVRHQLLPALSARLAPSVARLTTSRIRKEIADRVTQAAEGSSLLLIRGTDVAFSVLRSMPRGVTRLPPLVLDIDDIPHQALRTQIERDEIWGPRWLLRSHVPRRRAFDVAVFEGFHRLLVCSEDDRQYLGSLMDSARVAVLPNAVPSRPALTQTSGNTVLFVGDLHYSPNLSGLTHFLDRIWPTILLRIPSAELTVAGRIDPRIRETLSANARTTFLGFVNDLDSLYAGASAVIIPIYSGGGTRVKAIEAGMLGRPVVGTTLGLHGLGLENGASAVVADTDAEFAAGVVALLTDRSLASRLAANARNRVFERFSLEGVSQAGAFLFRSVATGPSRH